MIDVSVVIPAHERPTELREAISTVRGQTVPAREIVVIDDGSKPPLGTSLDPVPGLECVRLDPNGGTGRARNVGMLHATGRYIALLDSDDLWHPRRLELASGKIHLWSGPRRVIFFDNFVVRGRRRLAAPPIITSPKDLLDGFLGGEYFIPTSGLIFSSEWRDVLRFDERLRKHEDWDLLLRALSAGFQLVNLDCNLVYIRPGMLRPRASKQPQTTSSELFLERHRGLFSEASAARFWDENVGFHSVGKRFYPIGLAMLRGNLRPKRAVRIALNSLVSGVHRWARGRS